MQSLLAALTLLSAAALVQAQPAPSSDSFLRQFAETRGFDLGRPNRPSITPDEKSVLFLRSAPASGASALFEFDVSTGETRELLTPDRVLSAAEATRSAAKTARSEPVRPGARSFTSYALSSDGARILLTLSGRLYVVERASGTVTELATGAGVIAPRFSPDGRQVAYVRDHDVYRVDLATNTERRITHGGTPTRTHGLAELISYAEMNRFSGYWWSPDAKHLAYTEADTTGVETVTVLDVANPQRGGRPVPYPRPGRPNARVRLYVAPVGGGPVKAVRWDFDEYPYLATVRWTKNAPLTLVVQNRAQTENVVLAADLKTGRTRTLLTERDDAWVNLHQSFPAWLDDGSGFLWYTERNGASELELRRADGSLARSLVKPGAGFRDLVAYLEREDTLYFTAGPNPTEGYVWRAVRGGEPTRVSSPSAGPALEAGLVSRTGRVAVLFTEGPRSMRRIEVRSADGRRVGELPSLAPEPPFQPRLEVRQVGAERFWAALVRPRQFKPGVQLPVIVQVYGAGPPMVQQSMAQNLLAQWMADQGYLVVKLDGRGTWLRGRAWERSLKFDFAGIPLDDQISALRALAAEVPELDLDRVGIEGWSHGGYLSALAVMKRPDVFKAAVAGAPVADWLDYNSHLSERFLGLPQEHPEAYERNSLLTFARADRPIGRLLLIHGTADDNVFLSHTLKLSDALFRAGKPHEVLPIAGLGHTYFMDPVTTERLWKRVMRHFSESLQQLPPATRPSGPASAASPDSAPPTAPRRP